MIADYVVIVWLFAFLIFFVVIICYIDKWIYNNGMIISTFHTNYYKIIISHKKLLY